MQTPHRSSAGSATNHPTLNQRRAIRAYLEARREAIHHAERQAARNAPRQPEPANFCAADDGVPPAITGRQLVFVVSAWLACMLGSMWLCTDAGMRFLGALWEWLA